MLGFVSTIVGATGAALGAHLARLFRRPIGRAAAVALLAAGLATANPALQPFAGAALADNAESEQFDTVFKFKFLPAVKSVPSLERIFRDHPEVEAEFRARARAAYEQGGAKALVDQSAAIGATVLANAFISYMPKARGDDLILFATAMAGVFSTMNETDPEACILYQFGTKYGRPLENSRLVAAIGNARQKQIIDAMNAVVVNAADQPVAFDDAKATTAFTEVAVHAAPLLTGKSGEVAQGLRPPADLAEAKAACTFTQTIFSEIIAKDHDTAVMILRKVFAEAKA